MLDFDDWVDIVQTFVLALVALAQLYAIVLLRREAAKPKASAIGMMIGEQKDLKRRIEDLEEDVAELAMRSDKR